MNYDKIFEDNPQRDSYYNNDSSNKLISGFIGVNNAKIRLTKNEYYLLVTYENLEDLPESYVPINPELLQSMGLEDAKLATVNPNLRFQILCRTGSIQMISKISLPGKETEYLLGPGPNKVSFNALLNEQIEAYKRELDETMKR